MKRLLPASLFGQTMLVLFAGLVISLLAGSWIYTHDREQAVRAVGGFAAAERFTNLARLVRDAPADLRPRIIAGLSDRTFMVRLSPQPLPGSAADEDAPVALSIKQFLMTELALDAAHQPRVAASTIGVPHSGGSHFMMRHGPPEGIGGFGGFGAFRDLRASIPLPDGQWLTFTTALPEAGLSFTPQFMMSMIIMSLIVVAVSAWAVRRVTSPLASLASAAERLGRDMNAPPLVETGSTETRQASRAFNDMQIRLRNLIENRTRLLAAISHDLRTPLTLLRLRAESVENANERDRMLATIAEMDQMVGATLNFARDEAANEPRKPVDIAAMTQSIADDMSDAGFDVEMEPSGPIVYEVHSTALKRALTNLVENAVKYGQRARISLQSDAVAVKIHIDDQGPGIAPDDLKKVFEPFYRVESSRNEATGGVGLGLSIALSAVQAHGGELSLANRPNGGLRATVRLPK